MRFIIHSERRKSAENVVGQGIPEVDPEEGGPRDSGHPVLAAGDACPLVGDEVEELV